MPQALVPQLDEGVEVELAPLVGLLEVADGDVEEIADGLGGVDDPPVGQLEHLRLGDEPSVINLLDAEGLVDSRAAILAGNPESSRKALELLGDPGLRSGTHGHQHDHRRHTDEHTQHGESRTQLVGGDSLQRDANALQVHCRPTVG